MLIYESTRVKAFIGHFGDDPIVNFWDFNIDAGYVVGTALQAVRDHSHYRVPDLVVGLKKKKV